MRTLCEFFYVYILLLLFCKQIIIFLTDKLTYGIIDISLFVFGFYDIVCTICRYVQGYKMCLFIKNQLIVLTVKHRSFIY